MKPDAPAAELSMLDVVSPAQRDRYPDELLPAVERDGSWAGETEFVDCAGTPVPVWQVMVAHRDPRGRLAFYSTVCQDLRERRRGDAALHEERERYRSLVTQAPVGIWVGDRDGATTFVNDQIVALAGRPARELTGFAWSSHVHPDDLAELWARWNASAADGVPFESAYRMVDAEGQVRHVLSRAHQLRDADGAVTGYLGTTIDVTARRDAESARAEAAAEQAARAVSEAAAARLRAMVGGLAAIVWEAEWDPDLGSMRFTFVSDRAEELLGHPARGWLDDPDFWPRLVHPADRVEAVEYTAARTAAGLDHDLTYRAVAIDGRVVWLHQVVHVVCDADGAPLRAQGLIVDVSQHKRAERSTEVLAETGRLVTDPGGVEQKLAALTRFVAHDLGDAAVVSLIGPDGLLRRAAVAHDDPAVERAVFELAPAKLPAELGAAFAEGRPLVVHATEELARTTARDAADAQARVALGLTSVLVVPLMGGGRVIGLLSFLNLGAPRHYDNADLDLAAELGRRASLIVADELRRTRERQMQQVSADLAAADGVTEAARRLAERLGEALGDATMSVYLVEPERGIRIVHGAGFPSELLTGDSLVRFDDPIPLACAVRTGEPVWIRDRDEWAHDWPEQVRHAVAGGRHAAAAIPLVTGGRVVGALGVGFSTPRELPADERRFVMALIAQAAPAFERAVTADERRMIADTLQRSLLPSALPELDRLAFAARYLPGAHGTQAGGDWYDVLPLADGRVAVAVGDVVGQGATAAAIMGQLRSALSAYLLEGHDPVRALEHLDRFATRIPGAAGSTMACLVLDPETGELTWACAGHLPPLVVGPAGARYLDGAEGTVLAVRGRPPFVPGHARLEPGDSVVLYTDGLVERRGEVIDDGLDRLAASAAPAHTLPPAGLVSTLLAGSLPAGSLPAPGTGSGAVDDVALIVARLVPAPLRLDMPAEPNRLYDLRKLVRSWTAAVGLDEDDDYDLQLALGEAVANAVEHAYRDTADGTMSVELTRRRDGRIAARVCDRGSWRPEPGDKGHRGRGLDLIRAVSASMDVRRGPGGTEVRFTLSPGDGRPTVGPGAGGARIDGRIDAGAGHPTEGSTRLRTTDADPRRVEVRRVEIVGDLDLARVQTVRASLLAALGTSGTQPLTVDLTATTYLASAGVALLVEAADAARTAGRRLTVRVTPGGIVRRVLALSGVDGVLQVRDTP